MYRKVLVPLDGSIKEVEGIRDANEGVALYGIASTH